MIESDRDALPFTRRTFWIAVSWIFAVYAALSTICVAIHFWPALLTRWPEWVVRWAWLLGPPGLLMHGFEALWAYLPFTVILFVAVIAGAEAWRRLSTWWILFACCAAALWLVGGFLIYAPGV